MKFVIECEMKDRWVDHFCSMLKRMEVDGEQGHSEVLEFYADGDGDFRPKFTFNINFEKKEPFSREDGTPIYDAG